MNWFIVIIIVYDIYKVNELEEDGLIDGDYKLEYDDPPKGSVFKFRYKMYYNVL